MKPDTLIEDPAVCRALVRASRDMPSWDLTPGQLCDLELILNRGFAPLEGFMGSDDCARVCAEGRLADGTAWPLPVTLDVSESCAAGLAAGSKLALREPEGMALAVLEVAEVFTPDRAAEARALSAGAGPSRPARVAGRVRGLCLPEHHDFVEHRHTPAELGAEAARLGWKRVLGFPTCGFLHRAQFEATFRAATELGAGLVIAARVGTSTSEDIEHFTRVRACQALLPRYPRGSALLTLLPLPPRGGGGREAELEAIVCRNFGCTHVMLDPEGAKRVEERADALGIEPVAHRRMVYLEGPDSWVPEDRLPAGAEGRGIGQEDLRAMLDREEVVPGWFSFPEVLAEVQKAHPPRHRQGFTLFFTGLPGAGKSTVAKVVRIKLLEAGTRPVTLLDGDIVRKHLSRKLGFSREDRDINIRRIGFVASEITKNGGVAICAPIAPYDRVRKQVRAMIAPRGGFVLVHVATPLEVCEQRDPKGMYAKARAGTIRQYTGVSDPYETPEDAELQLDTSRLSPEECAEEVMGYLVDEGFLSVV